ncbi:hypothetical protein CK203_052256 [Vitis vinifera]|uniref:Uncharacterized protein n=1 Tax=Vitis vinifera TaxID=29760 RepID=A0A438FWE3_VITVI|nr:hypothetical protein CK203_052256 [Vitis vinifera]
MASGLKKASGKIFLGDLETHALVEDMLLDYLKQLSRIHIPCKRYYFSLFLELSDITMPLIRAIFTKVSDAVSFFLVCLIGRSLGLIYTGIRQSLRWN